MYYFSLILGARTRGSAEYGVSSEQGLCRYHMTHTQLSRENMVLDYKAPAQCSL